MASLPMTDLSCYTPTDTHSPRHRSSRHRSVVSCSSCFLSQILALLPSVRSDKKQLGQQNWRERSQTSSEDVSGWPPPPPTPCHLVNQDPGECQWLMPEPCFLYHHQAQLAGVLQPAQYCLMFYKTLYFPLLELNIMMELIANVIRPTSCHLIMVIKLANWRLCIKVSEMSQKKFAHSKVGSVGS